MPPSLENRLDRLEFFYPLSPQRAMLLVEASSRISDQPISAVSVNSL